MKRYWTDDAKSYDVFGVVSDAIKDDPSIKDQIIEKLEGTKLSFELTLFYPGRTETKWCKAKTLYDANLHFQRYMSDPRITGYRVECYV